MNKPTRRIDVDALKRQAAHPGAFTGVVWGVKLGKAGLQEVQRFAAVTKTKSDTLTYWQH